MGCATMPSHLLYGSRCAFPIRGQEEENTKEERMLSKMIGIPSLMFVFVFALGSAAWALPAGPAGACSNATLTGRSGFVITGTDANGPGVVGGQITADGKGGFTGVETISDNGNITADVSVTGSYMVRANCTGKGQITPKGGSASHFNFTIVSGGTDVQLVITDSGTVELGSAQAEGAATCTTKGVQGTYGLQATGTLLGLGPLVFSGQVKLHQGVVSGTVSGSLGGSIFTNEKIDGVVKVGKNCFGKAVVSVNQEPPLHLDLVVVSGGNEIIFVATDSETVVSGSLQR
jgi:hypothetical protein